MDMKTHHLLFILIALPLFCSCRSSRSMLREIQALKSSLYYELTSPIYQEKADQTVYLDFIDYSNMDYYTSVKRKSLHIFRYYYITMRANFSIFG